MDQLFQPGLVASMEPSIVIDGDIAQMLRNDGFTTASMEPSIVIDGDVLLGDDAVFLPGASMEPSIVIDGDWTRPCESKDRGLLASMEPSIVIDGDISNAIRYQRPPQ